MIIGILLLLLGGVCQGSFGIGYKKYSPLKWEAFWGVYSVFCFIIPLFWTAVVAPSFMTAILSVEPLSAIIPVLCGMAWGITAVGFSKAVDKIGVSLVYGLSMGVSAVVGSVTPLIMQTLNPDGKREIISTPALALLIVGLTVTLAGIAVITKAGLMKDAEKAGENESENGKTKSAMKIGLLLALFSGLGSAAMNIGFDFSSEIDAGCAAVGIGTVGVSAVKWLLVLFGGFISSTGCCVVLLFKNKTWSSFIQRGVPARLGILLLTCVVWFTALAAYGNATFFIGSTGTVVGWIVFNALALLISNLWGLKTGEWRGHAKPRKVLLIGNGVLILSWVAIGLMQLC